LKKKAFKTLYEHIKIIDRKNTESDDNVLRNV